MTYFLVTLQSQTVSHFFWGDIVCMHYSYSLEYCGGLDLVTVIGLRHVMIYHGGTSKISFELSVFYPYSC